MTYILGLFNSSKAYQMSRNGSQHVLNCSSEGLIKQDISNKNQNLL